MRRSLVSLLTRRTSRFAAGCSFPREVLPPMQMWASAGQSASVVSRTMSVDSRYRSHVQELIFDLYRDEKTDKIYLPTFFKQLFDSGIRRDDPRLAMMLQRVREADVDPLHSAAMHLDREAFKRCVGNSIGVIARALKGQLVVPDWPAFTNQLGEIFEQTRVHKHGNVATYIPQLARTDPNYWAMSVCTIDGQRRSWGDSNRSFCLQSVSKPFTYAMVHDELGPDELHFYVGQEPSGRLFNEICLDHNKKPHNPLINAGAIIVASLLKRQCSLADRFDLALRHFKKLCAGGKVGFNNSVFLSERETADRNYALSYFMREHKCFPPNTNLQETLDLYFQLCSIETNVDALGVMAATLANGGVNPLTHERCFNVKACRDTLSLMYSCGMYDWSGQFAFRIGLPAKSGVSGAMIVVVPNVAGFCLYSPRLDSLGNTVRGVKFAEAFIERFNFHNYDSLVYSDSRKLDPRRDQQDTEHDATTRFMYAARAGDISAFKRLILMGANMHERDYDERTVLHIAASEGNDIALEFLLSRWRESPEPRDRFGRTPLEDAVFFGHDSSVALLKQAVERWAIKEQHASSESDTGADGQNATTVEAAAAEEEDQDEEDDLGQLHGAHMGSTSARTTAEEDALHSPAGRVGQSGATTTRN